MTARDVQQHASMVLRAPTTTPLDDFVASASRFADRALLHYFDRDMSFAEIDVLSDAMASALREHGVSHGDRVGLFLQNDPDFAIAQLGAWKVGAVCVSINPMLRGQELQHILADCGARALIVLDELWASVALDVIEQTHVRSVFVTTRTDWTDANATPTAPDPAPGVRVEAMRSALRAHAGERSSSTPVSPDDVALICYTSGTSGRPKGVAATHRNVAYSAEVYRKWMSIDETDVFLGGAPIFHVTGLIAGLALAYRSGMSIVLFHRFEPATCLEHIERHRATFTVMATTAFQSLLHHPDSTRRALGSLHKVYSGGAPVTVAIDQQWRALTGRGIRVVYGLTETTGPTHAVPLDVDAPIDSDSGAMSIGVPLPGVDVRLVDAHTGADVGVGEHGEIWIRGPMVMQGYWQSPEATADAFQDGYFRTGDIAVRDKRGWFYVIDRLKDMINASGYKVWPREVEDYLLQHPAVREAAVVGVADDYRGETVKAFVVLRDGYAATPKELIAFGKQCMAAYKYPRQIEIVDQLPKTASGKVLRRELRQARPTTS